MQKNQSIASHKHNIKENNNNNNKTLKRKEIIFICLIMFILTLCLIFFLIFWIEFFDNNFQGNIFTYENGSKNILESTSFIKWIPTHELAHKIVENILWKLLYICCRRCQSLCFSRSPSKAIWLITYDCI